MAITPEQITENDRINAQMLATQQAKRDAKMAARTTATTSVTPGQEITTGGQGIGINAGTLNPVTPKTVTQPTNTTTPVQTGVTPTPTSPSGSTVPTTPNPGDDSIWQYDELSPEMKAQLDADPLAREQFDLIAKQGGQTITETVDKTLKYLAELRKQKDFNEDQARINLERQNIQNKAGERQLLQGIRDTKSNTYYSALSSAPSLVANTAAGARITEMAKQFDDFVQLNSLQGEMYTKQTAEAARRIQDDLNDKLGKTLAESLQNIDRSIADGTVLTEEQLMKVYKDNKDAMLKAFPTLTNFAVQQMSDLTTNFMNTQKELRASQDTFNKNENTYNKEMSIATGFAVDGNGKQILDVSGNPIEIPKDAPYPPQFDKETGIITNFKLDDDDNVYGVQRQIAGFVAPQSSAPKASDFIDVEVSDGMGGTIKKKYDVVNKKFLEVPGTPGTPEVLATTFDKSKYDVFATDNGCFVGVQTTDDVAKGRRQCGEFVNDILNGGPGWIPDSRADKLKMITTDKPVVGSAFIMDFGPNNPNAHTGIVEEVREDGIQIADMNRQGDEKFSRRFVPFDSPEYKLIKGYVTKGGTNQSNLSSLSKGVLEKKADYNKLTPTAKEKIQKELLEKGAITGKTGNIEFITANSDIPKEMEAVFQIYDNVKRAQELSKEVSTGFIDSKISKVGELFGGTKDDQELKQIIGKNLSMFMKELSGAAVSEQEVQRIKDFMPNFDQGDKKMDVNIKEQLDTLETTMKRLKRQYGFDSIEDMRTAIFGKK